MAKKRGGAKAKKSGKKAPKRAAKRAPKKAGPKRRTKKTAPKAAKPTAPAVVQPSPPAAPEPEKQVPVAPTPQPAPPRPAPPPAVQPTLAAPTVAAALPAAAEVTKPTHLSDAEFDKFVKENTLVLVDFWAPWCGPCRFIAPVVEELAQKHKGKLAVGKMNTDENTEIPPRYAIMAIPTLLVFKKGDLVDKIIGAVPKAEIERVLAKHF